MTAMVVEFPEGFLEAAREALATATVSDVATSFAGSALKAMSRGRHRSEVEAAAFAFFLELGHDLGVFSFEQVYGRPARCDLPKAPPPRRRHRKLGANVVDLNARRREAQDRQ